MINVGEYIRTKDGHIGSVININEFRPPESKICVDMNLSDYVFISEEDIKSHSKNILDVIEKNDWVNRMRAYLFIYNDDPEEKRVGVVCEGLGNEWIYTKDIKEILTHEAYNSNCFRIGEEND